jgi:hypothetical protein
MLDRISAPVALATLHDACRRHRVRHTGADYHSVLYCHRIHYLEQEQATHTLYQESTPHEKWVLFALTLLCKA